MLDPRHGHDGCKLTQELMKLLIWAIVIHDEQIKDYTNTKDLTPDFVQIMSHRQLAELLSFTTELGQSPRVIG